MTQVTLHSSWACPLSKSVEIALKLKGIPFTLIHEHMFEPSLDVIKKSPLCPSAPVLVHNGEVISNASVIMEYIDETWKRKSFFPKIPKDRAKARSLIHVIRKCMAAVMKACWGRGIEAARKTAIQNAKFCLETLENELSNGNKPYFGGDTIGVVDISAVSIALWVEVNAVANAITLLTQKQFTLLSKWADLILTNPIIKQTLPRKDVLLSFYQKSLPEDFYPATVDFRRRKLLDQYEPELDDEKVVEDFGGCYGTLRKIFNTRKIFNKRKFSIRPVDFSK